MMILVLNDNDTFQWRALAKELEGAVRIGAVNCADARDLCHHLRGYPSLYLYRPSGMYY